MNKINCIKICKNCQQNFPIYEEDLVLLKKFSFTIKDLSYEIPTPTLCRSCRDQRRSSFRNERNLHKITSSLSGKSMISFFDETSPFQVYTHEEWWSDNWEATDFGRDYNFKQDFFYQFYVLQLDVPRPPLVNNKAENSDYCNFADCNKNSYLVTSANRDEDSYYGWIMADNKDTCDTINIFNCELLYECIDCHKSYNLRFSMNCDNCRDSAFLQDCNGLSNCLFCINLRSKSYHIFNKQSSKDEYEKYQRWISGSNKNYQLALQKFSELKAQYPIRKSNNFVASENISGNNIFNSNNIHESFDTHASEDCRYAHCGLNGKDLSDVCFFDGAELCYESTSLMGYGYRFTIFCRDSIDLFYCDNCYSCKNCFGCVGLRNKQYCIFNKQYSKEQYKELVKKITNKMKEDGTYGEFFPIQYSLFPYNETVAQESHPVNETKAKQLRYKWLNEKQKSTTEATVNLNTLPDNIKDTDNSICQKILKCAVTGKPYKIIQPELNFYRKMNLPIPHKCPDQRFKERLNLRTPIQLWSRQCEKCSTEIYTPYSPTRQEKIYCEKCYLQEIY